jgi:hypothetical protein
MRIGGLDGLAPSLDVSVGWDTGAPAVKGRVFRSLNGG